MTRAQLLAAADAADAERVRLEVQAAALGEQAALLRDAAVKAPLTIAGKSATLATSMEAQTRQQRVSRARLDTSNRRHPFVEALLDHGLTVRDLAKELGYPRSTVQSWYDADKGNRRPIPRAAANAILARFGVPLDAWTRISD